jgi:hypothetical protein
MVEDVATDRKGDGPGNDATYEVGQFSVGWRNPGPAHRIGADNWNPTAPTGEQQGPGITADAPLRVTEGAAAGAQFLVTLSSPADADLTVNLSAPPAVLTTATVQITMGQKQSAPVTVTAGHDRNVTSEKVEITATISGGTDYDDSSGTIAVLAVDDDLTFETDVATVTEDTPFAPTDAKWVTFKLTPAEGGTATNADLTLPAGGDWEFRVVEFTGSRAHPYDPNEPVASTVEAFVDENITFYDVWLVATDDTDDEEPEMIEIGEDPTSEDARIEPVMITIMDADPDVTLSIEDVDEGAEEVTVTLTATAPGPMPGIFEIPANSWKLTEEDEQAGYALTASGTLTIDRSETEGTVSLTVTVPEDDDQEDGMLMVNYTGGAVTLSGADNVQVSVEAMVAGRVVDNDKEDGNGGG